MNVMTRLVIGSQKVNYSVKTRQVPTGSTHEVVDLLREENDRRVGALCVCVKCGATWDEGGVPASTCK